VASPRRTTADVQYVLAQHISLPFWGFLPCRVKITSRRSKVPCFRRLQSFLR